MKALVLYRSFYGNTKQVAEAIGERLRAKGMEAVVQDVRQKLPDPASIDLVFNGAPTRIKRANRRSVGILRKLKARGIGGKPIAIFDTCAVLPEDPEERKKSEPWVVPGAAGIMHRVATDLGLNVYRETLRCEVKELKGPLVDDALDRARSFADAVAASLKT